MSVAAMPPPDEQNANVVVIEMEPGWIHVKIAEPKPEPDRTELLLQLTIDHWINANPRLVIDGMQAVTEHGTLQGIDVWYHAIDRQGEPALPGPRELPVSLALEVHNQVFQQLPKEHIEALFDEAKQIWRSLQDEHRTLVVINPGRVAVVLDKQANRGVALTVELIYPGIDASARTRVETWLEAPDSRRHLIQIAGSWFSRRASKAQMSKVSEPTFVRTNMTYDTGPRPRE
jgi:hypothetical protein